MLKIFKISLLITVGLLFSFSASVLTTNAQNTLPTQTHNSTSLAQEEIKLDQQVNASDLKAQEPTILPTSKFYFLKNWSRGIQSVLTFNPVKKAELKLKFSSEKLLEVKKMAEKQKNPALLQKATQEYQKEIENIKTATLQIKEKTSSSKEVGKFLDKFTQQQILQEKILEKLEQQVPTSTAEKIKQAREQHLEKFGEVMQKLEDNQDKIKTRLENTFQSIQGSEFKEIKDLSILKKMEEKAPEQIKEAIKETRESTLQNFREKLEIMPVQTQEKLHSYLKSTEGAIETKMDLVEDIRATLENVPELKQKLEQTRDSFLEQSQEKIRSESTAGMCPYNPKYQPGFCKDGRIVIVTNEKGLCPVAKCIRTGEKDIIMEPLKTTPGSVRLYGDTTADESIQAAPSTEEPLLKEQQTTRTEKVCVSLWNPVCAKNGKTYSNKCWLNLAGQEIAYKGICKEELQSSSGGGGISEPTGGQICPMFIPPAPGFCQGGKIISGGKNEMGCPLPPKCIIEGEQPQCNISITCQEGNTPYDTGEKDSQGCPIRKCIPSNDMLGGDRDEHGCIGSAGYQWCEAKKKCSRIWEEECKSLPVPPSSGSVAPSQGGGPAGAVGVPVTPLQPISPSVNTTQGDSSWQVDQTQNSGVKTPTPPLPPPPISP